MALKQTKISDRSILHLDANSKEHAEDVAANHTRKDTRYVAFEVDKNRKPFEVVKEIGKGGVFIMNSGHVLDVMPKEMYEHTRAERISRSEYISDSPSNRKLISAGKTPKRDQTDIAQIGVTLSPWMSRHLYDIARRGGARNIVDFLMMAAEEIVKEFQRITRREVISGAWHTDEANIHFHMMYSRVDPRTHRFLEGTKKGIGSIGDESSLVLREKRYGMEPPDSKTARLAEHFRGVVLKRTGREPIDHALNILVDNLCEKHFGKPKDNPEIGKYLEEYRREYPLRALERVVAKFCGLSREMKMLQRIHSVSDEDMDMMISHQHRLAENTEDIEITIATDGIDFPTIS